MQDPVDAIMAVMHKAFDHAYGEAWTRRQVSDALVTPNTHFLLGEETEDGSGPTAFTLSRSAADEEELLLIAVRPEFRGKGLGSEMMEQFFGNARARGVRRVFLEMREGNPAEHLYRKLGFEEVGVRKGYYRGAIGGPLDAITFARDIK